MDDRQRVNGVLHRVDLLVLIFWLTTSCQQENLIVDDVRPNIILIMSDDMGYSDIAPYGGEIETPNLDLLADNGLKFTQFYNTGRCCPTRASLLTGCYPHEAGIGHMTDPPNANGRYNYGVPEYQGFLNKNTVTIAEVLKKHGYSTFMTGKWHLGYEGKDKWPLQRGFDKFYGIIAGAANFFEPVHPRGITKGNDPIMITDKNFYTTDAFTDNAIKFIDQSTKEDKDRPFFLYLAYNAPHWPIQAPAEAVNKYKGKYMDGWLKLREKRYERMKSMGLVNPIWDLTPPDSRDWVSLDEEKKKEMDLRMAIYAAMIDRMDYNIGKLVDSLRVGNLLDNTIIMFMNDNGACAEFSELGSGPKEQLETKDGFILSYGKAWANASNTPYREYKHWLHEGGIATPFIVHWPGGIAKDKKGNIIREYGFMPDVMATCLDLAKATYPKEYNGHAIKPMSGKSLKPLFSSTHQIHTEPIFWEHEGNKAVRLGSYKLVEKWSAHQSDNWELYNMDTDRTEMHNLIEKEPEVAAEMIQMYSDWSIDIGVLPWSDTMKLMDEKKKIH